MRTMLLALCVVTWAAPSQAAQRTKPKAPDDMATRAEMCRAMVGREVPEATDGPRGPAQCATFQRLSDGQPSWHRPMRACRAFPYSSQSYFLGRYAAPCSSKPLKGLVGALGLEPRTR